MTNYPNLLDDIFTLPTVSGIDENSSAINDLQEATLAVETELGISPRGIYSNVRSRLDILESRINIKTDGYFIPDGYVNSPLYLVNSFYPLTITLSAGNGAPTENRLDGSMYLRCDGYSNEGLYSRRNGNWKRIINDPWSIKITDSSIVSNKYTNGLQYYTLQSGVDGYIIFQASTQTNTSIHISYAMSSAETNNIYVRLDYLIINNGDIPNTSLITGTPFIITPGNDTNVHEISSVDSQDFSFLSSTDNIILFQFFRIGTNGLDTHSGDMNIIDVRIV